MVKIAQAFGCDTLVYHGWLQDEKIKDLDPKKDIKRWPKIEKHINLDSGIFFEIDIYWAITVGNDPVQIVRDFGERAPFLHVEDGVAAKGSKTYNHVPRS